MRLAKRSAEVNVQQVRLPATVIGAERLYRRLHFDITDLIKVLTF